MSDLCLYPDCKDPCLFECRCENHPHFCYNHIVVHVGNNKCRGVISIENLERAKDIIRILNEKEKEVAELGAKLLNEVRNRIKKVDQKIRSNKTTVQSWISGKEVNINRIKKEIRHIKIGKHITQFK